MILPPHSLPDTCCLRSCSAGTKLTTPSPHCPTMCQPGMDPTLFGGGPAPIGGRKAGLSLEIQVCAKVKRGQAVEAEVVHVHAHMLHVG